MLWLKSTCMLILCWSCLFWLKTTTYCLMLCNRGTTLLNNYWRYPVWYLEVMSFQTQNTLYKNHKDLRMAHAYETPTLWGWRNPLLWSIYAFTLTSANITTPVHELAWTKFDTQSNCWGLPIYHVNFFVHPTLFGSCDLHNSKLLIKFLLIGWFPFLRYRYIMAKPFKYTHNDCHAFKVGFVSWTIPKLISIWLFLKMLISVFWGVNTWF